MGLMMLAAGIGSDIVVSINGADRPAGAPAGSTPGDRGARPDFASMTDDQLEQVKARMRSKGMTNEQLEACMKRRRESTTHGV